MEEELESNQCRVEGPEADVLQQPEKVTQSLESFHQWSTDVLDENSVLANRMFTAFYEELRKRAHHMFVAKGRYTQQPTELVDELWLKVRRSGVRVPDNHLHFKAFAVQGMRWVFADYLRRRARRVPQVSFEEELDFPHPYELPVRGGGRSWRHDPVKRLHDAIERLRDETNPKMGYASLIELKYLGGFSVNELANYFQVPRATVRGRLFQARRHLKKYISES